MTSPRPLPVDANGALTAAPCRTCGVEVPLKHSTPTEQRDLIPTTHRYPDGSAPQSPRIVQQTFARCATCAGHLALAAAILEAHPVLAKKVGSVAIDRLEGAVVALALLGKPAPDPGSLTPPEVGRLLRYMTPEVGTMLWITRAEDAPGYAMPHPFAHVEPAEKTRLMVAWGALLNDRRAAANPPVRLAPPALTRHDLTGGVQPVQGGCLLCGVGAVEMSSRDVSRAGGTTMAADNAWTLRPACEPRQLGGRNRGLVRFRGYTCPACTEAVDRVGGLGPSAIERALAEAVGLSRYWGGDLNLSRTPGWGARVADALHMGLPSLPPNAEPWAHLGDLSTLHDRLAAALGLVP